MLFLVNTKTNQIIKNDKGEVIYFNTNNEACDYAGQLKISCWVECTYYNPAANQPRKIVD